MFARVKGFHERESRCGVRPGFIAFPNLYDSPDRKGNPKFKWVPKDLSEEELRRIIEEKKGE